jgi:hypothetical protein
MAKKSNGIFLVYVDIDAKHDKEFNDWYNTEHLPELLAVPGILSAARYKAVKGSPKYPFGESENVELASPHQQAAHARDSGSRRDRIELDAIVGERSSRMARKCQSAAGAESAEHADRGNPVQRRIIPPSRAGGWTACPPAMSSCEWRVPATSHAAPATHAPGSPGVYIRIDP